MTDGLLQQIALSLEYPVAFTRDAFAPDNRTLVETLTRREARRHRVVAFIDGGVARCWPDLAHAIATYARHHADHVELIACEIVDGGDAAKTQTTVDRLHAQLAAGRIDRHSFVLAIGGGAMLDVVGYAAATWHRGVRLVRMPTTVLAQNDAGVGVKNGINAYGAKNLLGTFAAPFAVINDSGFLATLDPRDRIAGQAEAVKVALIRDPSFFTWLLDHADALAAFEPAAIDHSIRRCAELHLAHIASMGDPFELGSARPLDFGHWAAHKLEMLTQHELRHGEAVAIGIALDSRYSVEAKLLAAETNATIVGLLERLGLPVWHDALHDPALIDGLREFREHLGGELCVTLLQDVGRGVETREIDVTIVRRAIEWLYARQPRT